MNLLDLFCFRVLNSSDFKLVKSALDGYQRSEFASKSELQQIQKNKLKTLLSKAQTHCSYWNQTIPKDFEASIEKKGVLAFLKDLPALSKPIIRQNKEGMWNKEIDRFIVATTGGTTGNPLTIHRDLPGNAITKAALWQGRRNWGIQPADRMIYLISFGTASFLGRLKMFLGNKRTGDAFPSTNADAQKVIELIQNFRPKALEGFASGLLESINRTAKTIDLRVPVLISTGEMLYSHQREQLESFYQGKVYTYYGSNEIGSIAYECTEQKLHIREEHVIVETVDENGLQVMNKPGKVLVTDLDNFAMPFIRYELGDMATLSDIKCKCGRNSLIIEELQGRTQDYLSSPDGNKLQATQLAATLKDLVHIGQLQFIQTGPAEIELHYSGSDAQAIDELQTIQTHVLSRLGTNIDLILKKVESIEKTNRGKQPLVVRRA